MRRAVAFLFHAPGLWLLYRERLDETLARANRVAVSLTLLAIATAWWLAPPEDRLIAPLSAWAISHVVWGSFLARRLPPR